MRLFVAVEPPEDVRQALWAQMAPWRARWPQVRWEPASKLHVTLRFLGEVRAQDVEEVASCVRETAAHYAPFRASLRGVGLFPGPRNPRVVWVGVAEGAKTLSAVQEHLEGLLEARGFGRDERPFSPHLTVARVKSRVPDARWGELSLGEIGFVVDRLVLKESILGPTGSVYRDQVSCPLGGHGVKE